MNTLKVAGHAPTQAGGHRLSTDRHTTRKKKAIEKYIKKKMSLKRERERDLSPTNCSGAAAGVSRGYGQDLRRFFFDFPSLFFCLWVRVALSSGQPMVCDVLATSSSLSAAKRASTIGGSDSFSFMFNRL